MTFSGWFTLAVIGLAALLLISERLRPDLTALLVLLTLGVSGILTAQEAFSGFSQSAVITILAIFILTEGLDKTRATRWLSRRLIRLAGRSERRLIVVLMLTSGVLSVFMNTIAAAAVLLPTAMSVARQMELRPSRILMPLAFAAMLGGTSTVLTTANIIVSSTLDQFGLQPFGLLEFAPIGLPLLVGGTLMVTWLGPRLLPDRDVAGEIARMRRLQTELAQIYHLREGTCEVQVETNSNLADQTLAQAGWGKTLGLSVLGVSHSGRLVMAPPSSTVVYAGDVLLLSGLPSPEQIRHYGLSLQFDAGLANALASENFPLVEVVLTPRSELEGRTLSQIQFRERFGLQVLAIWREGLVLQQNLAEIPLRFGDAMLMQGKSKSVELLRRDPNFLVLEEEVHYEVGGPAVLAGAIMFGSLLVAALGWLPIPLATLSGAVLMILSGCLSMDDAYQAIEWRTIFIVASLLPLSIALGKTGTAVFLGQRIATVTAGAGAMPAALVLILMAISLSLMLGGQTTAVIMAPIALASAGEIGADPRLMAMAVAVACSLAFVSPLGHPANLLVMGPGGYTFRDYFRLGAPLTLLSIVILLAGMHWIMGL
jgi:di/tricarboxylate transporter